MTNPMPTDSPQTGEQQAANKRLSNERPIVLGVIYAFSDRHQTFYMETAESARWIVQPEHWNTDDAEHWLSKQIPVVVTGMKAAGLPEIMRAIVTEVQFS